jgi:hypothetical protein
VNRALAKKVANGTDSMVSCCGLFSRW